MPTPCREEGETGCTRTIRERVQDTPAACMACSIPACESCSNPDCSRNPQTYCQTPEYAEYQDRVNEKNRLAAKKANCSGLNETNCKAAGINNTQWSYGTSCNYSSDGAVVNLNVNFDQEGAGKGGENPQCWSLHKLNPRAKFYHPDFGGTSRGGNELGTMANNLCGYVGVVGQDILKGQAGYCTNGNASRPDDGKDTNTQDSNNNVLSMAWPSLKDANCFPNARTTLPASTTNYTCGGHYTDLYGTDADFDDNLCSGLDFSDDEDHCDDSSKNGRGIFVGPSS